VDRIRRPRRHDPPLGFKELAVDSIDQAIDTIDREWRTHGLNRRDRTTLAADLRVDLQSAVDEGACPKS
jgi:hypothetical protein